MILSNTYTFLKVQLLTLYTLHILYISYPFILYISYYLLIILVIFTFYLSSYLLFTIFNIPLSYLFTLIFIYYFTFFKYILSKQIGQTAIGEVRVIANYLGIYPWEFESPFVLYINIMYLPLPRFSS